MTIDLEPCPFCGNKVDTQSFWYGAAPGDEPRGYHVFCLECSETDALDGPRRDTLDEAITAWNTRAPSAAARERDGLREALERIRDGYDPKYTARQALQAGEKE